MIKNTEVRIGNLIQDEFGRILYVNYPDNSGIECDYARMMEEDCYGIPITAEWIDKFGLFNGFAFAKVFSCWFDDNVVLVEEYGEGAFPLEHVKYVHQLQNVYHALTGAELEVKEKA